jgi:hypothetical protein
MIKPLESTLPVLVFTTLGAALLNKGTRSNGAASSPPFELENLPLPLARLLVATYDSLKTRLLSTLEGVMGRGIEAPGWV